MPFDPVFFDAPPVNPSPSGLYAVIGAWQNDPLNRFTNAGVHVRSGGNYGGPSGVWQSGRCGLIVTLTLGGATDGSFDLTVDGEDLTTIAYDVTTSALRGFIEGVDSVGTGGVTVTSPGAGTLVLTFPIHHVVSWDTTALSGTDDAPDGPKLVPELKYGERPDDLDLFDPITVWAYDECDLTAASQAEVLARAPHILSLTEQIDVETEVAARLLTDATDVSSPYQEVDSFDLAVGYLEAQMAQTGTLGFFHAGAQWASQSLTGAVIKAGTRWVSPLGNTWIFGGGYVAGLDDTIVATSQPFGWRDDVQVRSAIDQYHNIFAAVAERTVAVGWEHVITAVTITS